MWRAPKRPLLAIMVLPGQREQNPRAGAGTGDRACVAYWVSQPPLRDLCMLLTAVSIVGRRADRSAFSVRSQDAAERTVTLI